MESRSGPWGKQAMIQSAVQSYQTSSQFFHSIHFVMRRFMYKKLFLLSKNEL